MFLNFSNEKRKPKILFFNLKKKKKPLIKIMHIIRILYNAHISCTGHLFKKKSCTGHVLKSIIFLQMNDLNRSILSVLGSRKKLEN